MWQTEVIPPATSSSREHRLFLGQYRRWESWPPGRAPSGQAASGPVCVKVKVPASSMKLGKSR